jgi:hypothetical protein
VLKKMLSSFLGFGKKPAQDKKSDFKIEDDDEEGRLSRFSTVRNSSLMCAVVADSAFLKSLQINLSRLIAYAQSADIGLQREVRGACVDGI